MRFKINLEGSFVSPIPLTVASLSARAEQLEARVGILVTALSSNSDSARGRCSPDCPCDRKATANSAFLSASTFDLLDRLLSRLPPVVDKSESAFNTFSSVEEVKNTKSRQLNEALDSVWVAVFARVVEGQELN
ncbi:hypothetical protein ZIOFF_027003 [Zingiber officinale]|uniref:Uncharacterized protein n=1 Tax=Zingiber officinale TaxID=94328 RepID=A0A8J5H4R1_ZINOF|nr:hypothetical protein ZIOFF_027003 [Zingiber officinale]